MHAETLKQQGRLFPLFIFEMLTSTLTRGRAMTGGGGDEAYIAAASLTNACRVGLLAKVVRWAAEGGR